MIRGVTNIRIFDFVSVVSFLLNNDPRIGISESSGTPVFSSSFFVSIIPARAKVCPFLIFTFEFAFLVTIAGKPNTSFAQSSLLTSVTSFNSIMLSEKILGVISVIKPYSFHSIL